MSTEEILNNLCYYNKRNPNGFSDDDDVQTNRDNCSCDNCFYGRNKLALEIIKINDSYSELLQQVMKIHSK